MDRGGGGGFAVIDAGRGTIKRRWREYHKANPPEDEPAKECAMCGAPLTGKNRGRKYCSRFCYLLAVERGHSEEICEWCGEKFLDSSG